VNSLTISYIIYNEGKINHRPKVPSFV